LEDDDKFLILINIGGFRGIEGAVHPPSKQEGAPLYRRHFRRRFVAPFTTNVDIDVRLAAAIKVRLVVE